MRIVVLSDSHRMEEKLFNAVQRHIDNTDLFLFLGDGESDFDSVLTTYPNIKYERVAGNCDLYSQYPETLEFTAGGKKIIMSHGHPFNVKHGYEMIIRYAFDKGADILLFGHTHIQYTDYNNGLYIMNPGSIAFGNCYGVIDITDKGDIMLIKEKL